MYLKFCEHCTEQFSVKQRREFDGNRARKFCSMSCSAASNFLKNKETILKSSFQIGHKGHIPGSKKTRKIPTKKLLFGRDNPAFKDGKKCGIRNKFYKKLAKENFCDQCLICHDTKKLLVHHIDKNRLNHSLNNLCILCNSCHQRLHKLMDKENRIILPHEGVEILNNRKCRYKFKTPNMQESNPG